jgi:hypothetical protein
MRQDEQTGLLLLVLVLVLSTVFCAVTTNSGQAVGNIFANIISNLDDPNTPAVEAQYEPIKREFGSYWLIGPVAVSMALLTLIAIIVYMVARQRIPRSWCLFLLLAGAVASVLILVAQNIQTAIAAVPVSPNPFANSTHDSLVIEANTLAQMGELGGVLAVVGLILLVWSLLVRQGSSMEQG